MKYIRYFHLINMEIKNVNDYIDMYHSIYYIILFIVFMHDIYTQNYTIADSRYNIPECDFTKLSILPHNHTMNNQLGYINIDYDIIRDNITFDIVFYNTDIRSCYLCDHFDNVLYCNESLKEQYISLSNSLSYNMITIAIQEDDIYFPINISNSVNYQFKMNRNTNQLIIPTKKLFYNNMYNDNDCSKSLYLIILPIIKISFPLNTDFLSIVYDKEHINDYTQQCNRSKKIFKNIDCSITGGENYHYIKLETPNCVAMKQHTNTIINYYNIDDIRPYLKESIIYTSFDWYKEYYTIEEDIDNEMICGENWLTLLKRMNLESFYCGKYAMIYVKMKPWYKLALQVITTKLNIRFTLSDNDHFIMIQNIGLYLLLGYESLERGCLIKDSLDIDIEYTYFYNVYNKLRIFNNDFNDITNNTIPVIDKNISNNETNNTYNNETEKERNGTIDNEGRKQQHYNTRVDDFCIIMKDIMNKTTDESINDNPLFLPSYLSYYDKWYFSFPLFRYLIFYITPIGMGNSVIILLSFIALCTIFLFITTFILPSYMFLSSLYRRLFGHGRFIHL